MLKKPVNQGFFEDLVSQATKSEKKILNYLFKFCLHAKHVYACNATIAHALHISSRTVGRFFVKFKDFFIREERYRVVNGRRMQCASRTRLRSWVFNIDVLKALAWVIPAIRSFPRMLMESKLPTYTRLFVPVFFGVSTLLSVILSNQNKNELFLNKAAAKAAISSNKQSQYVRRGSAEGGKINSTHQATPQRRKETMKVVAQFNQMQQSIWDSYSQEVQRMAEQRYAAAMQQGIVKNAAGYLLKAAQGIEQDKQKKQITTTYKQQAQEQTRPSRITPSIEQQAQQKAKDYTLSEIDALIATKKRILTQADKRDERYIYHLTNSLESFERARIIRMQTETPQEPTIEPEVIQTHSHQEMAAYLGNLMPEHIKQELLVLKSQSYPQTKNNPVLDIILKNYLEHKSNKKQTEMRTLGSILALKT